MDKIIEKITSYNLFNYLLPGILFVVILGYFTPYSLAQENIIIGAFVYYFVGLVVSRFGSLVVEPLLKSARFLNLASYSDFVAAAKVDSKIDVLSETNNMYRTFVSMLVLLAAAKIYELFSYQYPFLAQYGVHILLTMLLVMFLFSYRKQTSYIRKRVELSK